MNDEHATIVSDSMSTLEKVRRTILYTSGNTLFEEVTSLGSSGSSVLDMLVWREMSERMC